LHHHEIVDRGICSYSDKIEFIFLNGNLVAFATHCVNSSIANWNARQSAKQFKQECGMTELFTMVILVGNLMSATAFSKSLGDRALARIPTRNAHRKVPRG
jgi:hypothetical protein